VAEFKTMVKTLHRAGIEVILDVVFNHTGEGDHEGPTLCFRGIDNAAYYRLRDDDPRRIVDYSGCGNGLQMRHPQVLGLVMDSLRYWIIEMHVDGFRFDMAAALARELHEMGWLSAFFDMIQQDPVVSQVKLIADPWGPGERKEPWDMGINQTGNFPPPWTEWNGKYRDTMRDFWRGRPVPLPEFSSRLTGSSDLYRSSGRRPVASINFIACHDGFTLLDLVSHDRKHNEPNLEGGRDGFPDNRSWNCGVEGHTDDPEVVALRGRQRRNFLATLLLSQGVPLLMAGDELGRTQLGNNNPYCQDNEVSWVDWEKADEELLGFVQALTRLRREHPVFRRRRFFRGAPLDSGAFDIAWFTPSGQQLTDATAPAQAVAVFLNGEPHPPVQPSADDSFLLLFNASPAQVPFDMPPPPYQGPWQIELDTAMSQRTGGARVTQPTPVAPRSLCVLRRPAPGQIAGSSR
jgi:glycogen operon protein